MFKFNQCLFDSDGSNSYVIITGNEFGVVAVRRLDMLNYRVVVKPASRQASTELAKVLHRNLFVDPSWKQPGDNCERFFFTQVDSAQALIDVVAEGVAALEIGGAVECDWLGALAAVADVGNTHHISLAHMVIYRAGKNGELIADIDLEEMSTTQLMAKLADYRSRFYGGEVSLLADGLKLRKVKGFALAQSWNIDTVRTKCILAWPHVLTEFD